jgi:uncharacterized protein
MTDPASLSDTSCRGPVDMHVHIVGNGLAGSGCRLKLSGGHRRLADFMLHQLGMTVSWAAPEFDEAYVEQLLRWLRTSALTHAVILAHEEVYHEDGTKIDFGSMHVPNEYVLRLAREYPDFLPGVSIHPGRRDAMEELERCLAGGAALLKLLPNCQNVDCSRPAYRPFWERMAAAGLPFLAHTGGEHTVPQWNTAYANPATLQLPLECGVNVIAAHCATRSGPLEPDYLPALLKMMQRWPNLYGDLSALNLPLRSAGLTTLIRPEHHARLVHGSDYPVPVQPLWAKWRGLVTAAEAGFLRDEPNFLERDYHLKVAMGFPPEVFTRIWGLRLTGRPGGSV